ncbi:hypothetical protein [Winslowiella toletana]|uniref:hypothetical protein n=1 Tax=Winslowiella toletana TaxID=92490 RepID=UPI0028BE0B7E|nr:hypothetical protein [Winslowiella toletana]WNN42772.1 hypothetical protein RIN69_13720 [Winslowiella toletana]
MSLSDTKQAHMYATVAEVAAAQCKAYTEEARKAPEYVDEARKSAERAEEASAAAEEASQQAASSVNESSQNASNAQASADAAALSAQNAQNIADANTYYITPADPDGTIAGLANTPIGDIFRVAQGEDANKSFITYLNDDGVAKAVASQPGSASITNLIPLNETTKYSLFSKDGEFEFSENYDIIQMDKENNLINFLADDEFNSLVTGNYPKLRLEELEVRGKSIDPEGILSKDTGENITNLSNSANFMEGVLEYEFNQNTFVRVDEEYNVIFDNDEYLVKKPQWDDAVEKVKNPEPQKINPLAPFTQIDASGNSQVRVINTETNKETAITNGASNETDVRPDVLDRIVWKSDREDSAPGGLFYAAYPDFKEHSYIARSKIAGWGHSFMDNAAFLNKLASLTGLPTYNFGKSSLRSTGIAARQGGDPTFYMPVGGVIPASGSVNLTPNVAGPAANFGNTALSVPPSVLAGIEGTFTWNGSQASFTRTTAGSAVNVPEPVALYVRPFTTRGVANSTSGDVEVPLNDEFINIFWLGRNNINQTETIIKNAIAMVNYLKNVGKRVVILPDFNNGSEPSGSSGYIQMAALNAALKSEFPEFYCEIDGVDLRANFIAHGNPDYERDAELMAQDATPNTLRYDVLHPAQTLTPGASGVSLSPEYALGVGAEINAEFVYNFMKLKGWVI